MGHQVFLCAAIALQVIQLIVSKRILVFSGDKLSAFRIFEGNSQSFVRGEKIPVPFVDVYRTVRGNEETLQGERVGKGIRGNVNHAVRAKVNRGYAGIGKGALTEMLQCGRQRNRRCVNAAEGFFSDRLKAFGQDKSAVAKRAIGKSFIPDGFQAIAPAEI